MIVGHYGTETLAPRMRSDGESAAWRPGEETARKGHKFGVMVVVCSPPKRRLHEYGRIKIQKYGCIKHRTLREAEGGIVGTVTDPIRATLDLVI